MSVGCKCIKHQGWMNIRLVRATDLVFRMDEQEYKYFFEILKHNKGFQNPHKWVDYAKKNNFRKVDAVNLYECPDCGDRNSKKIGQYIYYSNLIGMRVCKCCSLIYSDTMLNEDVIRDHFEKGYKNEEYFSKNRRKIFLQITELVSRNVPHRGKIIDIGGAIGRLAKSIAEVRPDLEITVSDLSKKACDYVNLKLGLQTLCSPLKDLLYVTRNYDLALLIDVLYYEPEINRGWQAISTLIRNGSIIIRIPNKVFLTMAFLFVKRLFLSREKQEMLDYVDLLNPEHIYIFSRKYMKKRLKDLGFKNIKFIPSKFLMSSNSKKNLISDFLYVFAVAIYYVSFKKVILTTSQLVCAEK